MLACDWLEVRQLNTELPLRLFAQFSQSLVGKDNRNLGECSVLALAKAEGAIAVIDDRAARRVGEHNHVTIKGTLGLMVDAIRAGLLTVRLVSQIADDLLASEYRLPFAPGDFEIWARQNDLF